MLASTESWAFSPNNLALPADGQRAGNAGPSQPGDAFAVLSLTKLVAPMGCGSWSRQLPARMRFLWLRLITTVPQLSDLLADFSYSERKDFGKMPLLGSCCKTWLRKDWSPVA